LRSLGYDLDQQWVPAKGFGKQEFHPGELISQGTLSFDEVLSDMHSRGEKIGEQDNSFRALFDTKPTTRYNTRFGEFQKGSLNQVILSQAAHPLGQERKVFVGLVTSAAMCD